MISSLKPYSTGTAAENLPRGSRHLNVFLNEVSAGLDGEINFNPQASTINGLDAQGNDYSLEATTDVTVTAEWIPFGSNRVTPPDLRRGEPVEVYRLADTDKYYWTCLGIRDDLRRLETVILAINANPNIAGDGINVDECYFLEVSSHDRKITFGTSQLNGEAFRYNGQLNLLEGEMTWEDDIGNTFFLRSREEHWQIVNASGTTIEMTRGEVLIHTTTGNITLDASESINLVAGDAIRLRAGNQIYQTAPEVITDTNTYTVNSPDSFFLGNVSTEGNTSIQGSLGVAGGISMGSGGGGSMTVQGNMNLEGDVNVSGDMRCRNIYADNIN